jgi:adenylate cyclase
MQEIERKFLVDKKLWTKTKSNVRWSDTLVQGYLSKAPTHNVRVRVGTKKAEITIKGKKVGITRYEFNCDISIKDGNELLKLCDSKPIKKFRHYINIGNHLWTVDEFFGANKGLLLAEIELLEENELFEMPDWATTEVTHDRRYTNAYLTSHKI